MTYLLSNGRSAAQRVIEYAGHFKLTQNKSIIESLLNLIVSLICVNKFGIYGVLCGTIVALLYRTNDMIIYASIKLLKRSPMKTYLKWGSNAVLFILFTVAFNVIYSDILLNNYIKIVLHAALASIIIIPTFFIMDSIIDKASFKYCIDFLKNHLKKKECLTL